MYCSRYPNNFKDIMAVLLIKIGNTVFFSGIMVAFTL